MADLKLSDLIAATTVTDDTFFYAIQNGVSKKFASNVLTQSLTDPVLRNKIIVDGIQLIKASDTTKVITIAKTRTNFDAGPFTVYPTLPNGDRDGILKILTLSNVQGGSVNITTDNSNIYPNTSVILSKTGDSITLLYSSNSTSNGWILIATTPGVKTSILLDEANISDARIRKAISSGDGTITYDEANGKIRVGDISNLTAKVSLANVTTDQIPEGNTNLYFTNNRVRFSPIIQEITRINANVLYVATNGNDSRDGLTMANAVANIHTALARANAYWSVKVFPGDYTLYNNPVTIPKRVSLIGNDLRTVTIRPQANTSDMFYVNVGVYVNGFTFRGHKAANPNNVKAGSACFSYNPDGSAGNITTSPYIQNCSSITTTGTGIRVDGAYVGGLRSMVLDAFTQFNEGGIGVYMLNRGYTQLVSVFTICCEYSVLCEAGGFGSITNSNTSFGTYGLVADGVSPTLYSANIIRQINSRTVEVEMNVVPNIQDRVLVANYNQDKCSRDTGLIADSIAVDLLYDSNTQSRFSGLQYWGQGINVVNDEKTEVANTFSYLQTLATNVVTNSTAWDNDSGKPYSANTQVIIGGAPGTGYTANLVANLFETFIDIYSNGIFAVTEKIVPNGYFANADTSIQNTANLLQQNKAFMQGEIAAYFLAKFPTLTYIPGITVSADVGKIIDCITFDIRNNGNRQTVSKAIRYYSYTTDSTIQNQKVQTSAAFKFIKTFIDEVLNKQTIVAPYQTAYTQNTSVLGNVTSTEIAKARARIDDITNIIENGPTYENVQYNIEPIGLTANTNSNIVSAANIIFANRDFIRAEVLEYVNQSWMDISNGSRNFYTVNESSNTLSNVHMLTFDEKILSVDRPFANNRVSFHQGSYLSASGQTFEYVGAGTTLLTALPYAGGRPIQENEVVESRGGAIYYTSTDHKGDFRIGNELLINRATGTINGRTFNKSLFAVMTPYILAIQ